MSGNGSGTNEPTIATATGDSKEKQKNRLFMPSSYYQDLNNVMMKNNHRTSSTPTNNNIGAKQDLNNNQNIPKPIQKFGAHYVLYIYAGRNNTHVHLSLASTGSTIAQVSAGLLGLKKAARSSSDAGFNTTALLLKKLSDLKVPGFFRTSTTPVSPTAVESSLKGNGKLPTSSLRYSASYSPSIHVKLKGFGKGRFVFHY